MISWAHQEEVEDVKDNFRTHTLNGKTGAAGDEFIRQKIQKPPKKLLRFISCSIFYHFCYFHYHLCSIILFEAAQSRPFCSCYHFYYFHYYSCSINLFEAA